VTANLQQTREKKVRLADFVIFPHTQPGHPECTTVALFFWRHLNVASFVYSSPVVSNLNLTKKASKNNRGALRAAIRIWFQQSP